MDASPLLMLRLMPCRRHYFADAAALLMLMLFTPPLLMPLRFCCRCRHDVFAAAMLRFDYFITFRADVAAAAAAAAMMPCRHAAALYD